MKGGVRSVANGNGGVGVQGGGGDKIVVRWGRVFSGTEWTNIDDRALKFSAGTFFFHFIGGGRKNLGDETGSSPSNEVV